MQAAYFGGFETPENRTEIPDDIHAAVQQIVQATLRLERDNRLHGGRTRDCCQQPVSAAVPYL